MKKIRNARELREARMNLELRELHLEKELRNDWEQIREILHLNGSKKESHAGNEHWLVSGLHTAATALSKKLLDKAEEKIESGTDKVINYMGQRVNRLFGTKMK
ncbi:MAG: hypothetical protein ACHQET_00940 [Chitinophagales bacterium]